MEKARQKKISLFLGPTDISDIVKDYFDKNGYDFDSSDEDDDDDWGDDDWED